MPAKTTKADPAAQLAALEAALKQLMAEAGAAPKPAPTSKPAAATAAAAAAYTRGSLTMPETAPNPEGSRLRLAGLQIVDKAGATVASFGPVELAYNGLIETKAGGIRHRYATDPLPNGRAQLTR